MSESYFFRQKMSFLFIPDSRIWNMMQNLQRRRWNFRAHFLVIKNLIVVCWSSAQHAKHLHSSNYFYNFYSQWQDALLIWIVLSAISPIAAQMQCSKSQIVRVWLLPWRFFQKCDYPVPIICITYLRITTTCHCWSCRLVQDGLCMHLR